VVADAQRRIGAEPDGDEDPQLGGNPEVPLGRGVRGEPDVQSLDDRVNAHSEADEGLERRIERKEVPGVGEDGKDVQRAVLVPADVYPIGEVNDPVGALVKDVPRHRESEGDVGAEKVTEVEAYSAPGDIVDVLVRLADGDRQLVGDRAVVGKL